MGIVYYKNKLSRTGPPYQSSTINKLTKSHGTRTQPRHVRPCLYVVLMQPHATTQGKTIVLKMNRR
jgi:hypothetical protein